MDLTNTDAASTRCRITHHRLTVFLACCLVVTSWASGARAQPAILPPQTLALEDFSSFRGGPANWSLADSVWADPERDRHLEATSGTGVLVNQPTESARGHLLTTWTHGDLDIEMEVLMPRASNSGIYLQGRYEIQLLDSWGVSRPTFADMGGIYQRWRPERPNGARGMDGRAPRVNVAKAPGLWQHLEVDFRAPRFNAEGEKIAHARFERVALNGVVIHRNIEVRGPTRAAAFDDEAPTGPLMIQGDHGPVAVKNVRYKRYQPGTARLIDLHYQRYDATLNAGLHQLDTVAVAERGPADRLSQEVIGRDNDFAAVFDGTLEVPRTGHYAFELVLPWMTGDPHFTDRVLGGGRLRIDDQTVLTLTGGNRSAKGAIELEEGRHAFQLTYFKNRPGAPPRVALYTEGTQMRRQALTARARPERVSAPILVKPESEPVVLRSFFQHGATKKTHAVTVGGPRNLHYAYDLAQGSLLQAWKGPFVQANPMWEGRGIEQRVLPQGSGPVFSGGPSLAVLPTSTAAWPDSVQQDVDFKYLGYRLDAQGQPTFQYQFEGLTVEDQLRADSTGGRLIRTIQLTGQPVSDPIFVRLVRADTLQAAGARRFVAGDRQYYVDIVSGAEDVRRRRSESAPELLMPVSADGLPIEIRYVITW